MLSFLGFGVKKTIENSLNKNINYEDKIDPVSLLKFSSFSHLLGETHPKIDYYDIMEAEYNQKCLKELDQELIFKNEDKFSKWEYFDHLINEALDYDFEKVLRLAVELRKEYRLKQFPQKIIILALIHSKRSQYNQDNPKVFRTCLVNIIEDVKDMNLQHYYWKYFKSEDKSINMPSCIKRVWKEKLENMHGYLLQKDKNLVPDLVRVCHARGCKNYDLNNIIRFGSTELITSNKNWRSLRSLRWTWYDILENTNWKMEHSDALDNFISFVKETQNKTAIAKYGLMLVKGVRKSKEQPIRYYNLYNNICLRKKEFREEDYEHMFNIISICFDESLYNFHQLEGDTIILCDNSISSEYLINTCYGKISCSEISNFMGLLTAYKCKGKGVIGLFGYNLDLIEVDKNRNFFEIYNEICLLVENIEKSTENGLLEFFQKADKYDNIIIYSDMQPAYGYLYGTNPDNYKDFQIVKGSCKYLDVLGLLKNYRKTINNKTNFYSIKVSPYYNQINVRSIYRGGIINGWSGRETDYIYHTNKFWNDILDNE